MSEAFLDPIFGTVMKDPVILLCSGISYERSSIETWLKENQTDPITRQAVPGGTSLVPNVTLRNAIAEVHGPQERPGAAAAQATGENAPSSFDGKQRPLSGSAAGDLEASGWSMDELDAAATASALQPLIAYVLRHERGDTVPWREVKSSSAGGLARQTTCDADDLFDFAAKRDVKTTTFKLHPQLRSENVEYRGGDRTMTARGDDNGGCALGDVTFSTGQHYWEVMIEAMWDSDCSDGSVRLGLATTHQMNLDGGLGDGDDGVGWWDNTVDGTVFRDLSKDVRFKEGVRYGLLLDLENSRLELYQQGSYLDAVDLPSGTFSPAFYSKTSLDRITVIKNPPLPSQQRYDFEAKLQLLEEYVRCHERGNRIKWHALKEGMAANKKHHRAQSTLHSLRTPEPKERDVRPAAFKLDPRFQSKHVQLDGFGMAMTALADTGGCALGTKGYTEGQHYWEVTIDAMWDPEGSDGSIRLGVATSQQIDLDCGLGDNPDAVSWWDSTIDGHIYRDLGGDTFKVGASYGMLLDLNSLKLELYCNKIYLDSVDLPRGIFYPAFFCRTKADKITLVPDKDVLIPGWIF